MGAGCCKIFSSGEIGDSYSTIRGSSQPTPDPEERRRQLAEAAEKRRQAEEKRGVQNVESVRRARQRQEEMEKQEELANRNPQSETTLRWQVS